MEYTKGSSYLPKTSQLSQEDGTLERPLLTDPSVGSPSRCRLLSTVSKVLPNLVVALLLLSMGVLMYNTNCSISMLVSMEDSSQPPHSKSAHDFESLSSPAGETRLHSRLRRIAQYLSISPAAATGPRRGAFQLQVAATEQLQLHYDAAPPSAPTLVPKDSELPDQVLPSRGLAQVEQMEGEPRWPNLDFQQKTHPMPNGPDPIHNR
ncbi:unnamed protein product [Calypogeia fissa]